MNTRQCHILLVEEQSFQADLVRNLLGRSRGSALLENVAFVVTVASTLQTTLQQLQDPHCHFDLILLDLCLSDSNGIDTLAQVQRIAPTIPIVIQTGSDDETLVVQAFQMGAYGYVLKKHLDQNLLLYSIRLALERHYANLTSQRLDQEKQQEQEFQNLEDLARAIKTSVTARLFGSASLQEAVPDIFQEYVDQYARLLELLLEQRAFKVDHHVSEQLREMADKLGFLKASPRDVIEIHTEALRQKRKDASVVKIQAYVSEGRLMVLELMGYLTSHYRKYYIGLSNMNIVPQGKRDR